nr:glutamate receptor ionotropic, kainate 3-like [Penaeus vannamei]
MAGARPLRISSHFNRSSPYTKIPPEITYAGGEQVGSTVSTYSDNTACKQITFGVQAIFGPFDPLLGSHIQSITDALDIPHLEARLDMEPQEKEFSINLFPSHLSLNQAYKDMIQFLKWKKIAIIYEEDFGLMKLQEIIRSPPDKSIEIYIRQGHPENYRDILKEVKYKEIFSVIVDTLPENMHLFLRCLLQFTDE